jgi:lipopolysaccharide export system permease protein
VILSRYIARRFLLAFAGVLAIFVGLMMLIDMVEQIRRFADSDVTFRQVVGLAALNVPEGIYRILPLVMILAAITLFLSLARSSELVVVRATGRSALRLAMAPVTVAVLLGAGAVVVLNPLVAGTTKFYGELVSRYQHGQVSTLSVSPEGLWLRQGTETGQTVIRAARANEDGTELFAVSFFGFDPEGRPLSRIEAESARLTDGAWQLTQAKRWPLHAANPELGAEVLASIEIPSDLTRERIRDSFGEPSAIPIWDLPDFIRSLDAAGFSARAHRVWFQMELAQPVLMAAMVLIAAGFTMRHARFGGTGTLVLLAVLAGFGIFFLRNFAQVLGENGQIPVLLAAWSPPLGALLLALGLLLHLEDG